MDETTGTRPAILVLTTTFPRWADDNEPPFVFELSRRLSDRFDIHVLAPHAPGSALEETMDGITVHRFRYAPTRSETLTYGGGIMANLHGPARYLLALSLVICELGATVRLLRQLKFYAIHAHWIFPQGFVAVIARTISRTRVPILVTSHGADLFALQARFWRRLNAWVVRHSDSFAVVSTYMAERAKELLGVKEPIHVAPMGVDLTHRFVPSTAPLGDVHRLLFVGRLVDKKGLSVLLDAMPEICAQVPDIHLDVIGDGPLREVLLEQTKRLGLQDKVRFLGALPQSQLPYHFQRATATVFPSIQATGGDEEGLGLVPFEAMGCGCPVIASDIGVIANNIVHEETGLLFHAGSATALAEMVFRLIRDKSLQKRISAASRRHAIAQVEWSSVTTRYHRLLDNLSALP